MKRFIEGVDRSQTTLFPDRLEDWVDDDNPVRVIDVFVDELKLFDLGFERVAPRWTGRPGYPSGGYAEALHLRLPQPGSVEPSSGAGSRSQRGSDVADGPPGAGSQDDRRLPQG